VARVGATEQGGVSGKNVDGFGIVVGEQRSELRANAPKLPRGDQGNRNDFA
jgi:hypothetical protein